MKKQYDYLIVGSGMFGAVCARKLTDLGFKCLVIDQREHIAGNCYTETKDDIHIHKYGPHIFHTDSKKIWDDINNYVEFLPYNYKPIVSYNDKFYSFPINLLTLYQMYNVKTPKEAIDKLESVKSNIPNPKNLEEYVLSLVGEDIYKTFIYGYTKKQWGREPKELPMSIIKRIPIRTNFNDSYFFDKYQGIPKGGYTELFKNLLNNIEVRLNTNYFNNKEYFDNLAETVIYTGKIDEYFNYCYGELEYRTLKFDTVKMNTSDFQGVSVINHTSEDIPYTRTTEHKHFELNNKNKDNSISYVTYETPDTFDKTKTPYYPVNDEKNNKLFSDYKELTKNLKNVIFGGRLADYKYYDMHQVYGSALKTIEDIKINKNIS
jgi:UDP-galactopyranose mutase